MKDLKGQVAELWRLSRGAAWEDVVAAARNLRSQFPREPVGWLRAAFALRQLQRYDEADAILLDAILLFPDDPQALIESAWVAQNRGDWRSVERRAAVLVERFPEQSSGYLILAYAHRGLKQFEYAECVLADGARRFPDATEFQMEGCWLALGQENWSLAADRSARLRSILPTAPAGYQVGVTALRNLKRWDEAEAVLAAAAHSGAPAEWIPSESLRLAEQRGSAEKVVALVEQIVGGTPAEAAAYPVGARAYRKLGRLAEAERLLDRAMAHLPPSVQVLSEFAGVAQDRKDWTEADRRWAHAVRLFPDEATVALEFAESAMRRHDWSVAVERWTQADRRFPGLPWIRKRLFDAQLAITESAVDTTLTETVGPGSGDEAIGEESSMEQVVACFESLAGTYQGCEFGRVQRQFGCEPLGLFRWGQIDIEDMIRIVESRFEGVGSPEQTELTLYATVEQQVPEYQLGDTRYELRMHTFIRTDEMPREKMFSQSTRRLQFLRRKLLEDLAESRKIFVYKRGHALLRNEDARRLSQALRSYSPDNVLLCVHLATAEKPGGTLDPVSPHLMFGYVSYFSETLDHRLRTPAYAEWASLCRQALALRNQATA